MKTSASWCALSACLLLLTSCSLFQTKTYTWDWRRDYPQYHALAKHYIQLEAPQLVTTIPSDIQNYCPDYLTRTPEERLEFWGLFLSAISWMESSHRTALFYEEKGILDRHGNNVISRGLLQFSYESATGYLPTLATPEDLHNPSISLRIGAIALNRFIVGDGVVSSGGVGNWRGAARYWSVLRRNHKHPQIQAWLRGVDYDSPKNNIIPPPPHAKPADYTPWIRRVF